MSNLFCQHFKQYYPPKRTNLAFTLFCGSLLLKRLIMNKKEKAELKEKVKKVIENIGDFVKKGREDKGRIWG